MASVFVITLISSTIITGVIWCIQKFKLVPERYKNKYSNKNNIRLNNSNLTIGSMFFHFLETLASIFPVLLIVLIIRSFIVEPFQIPSGSMMPCLAQGDFVIVIKYIYGLKDPITQITLISTGHPQRGDVAVFKYPHDEKLYYVKRVIGLPGDKISMDPNTNELTIQTDCDTGICKKKIPINYSNVEKSDYVEQFSISSNHQVISNFYQVPPNKTMPNNSVRLLKRKETIGTVTHDIFIMKEIHSSLDNTSYYKQPGQPTLTWVVPKGQYFMMGDNRDNSSDSRYWGFVPEKNFVGKVVGIWMSVEKQEGKWPTGIRFNRIGSIH